MLIEEVEGRRLLMYEHYEKKMTKKMVSMPTHQCQRNEGEQENGTETTKIDTLLQSIIPLGGDMHTHKQTDVQDFSGYD